MHYALCMHVCTDVSMLVCYDMYSKQTNPSFLFFCLFSVLFWFSFSFSLLEWIGSDPIFSFFLSSSFCSGQISRDRPFMTRKRALQVDIVSRFRATCSIKELAGHPWRRPNRSYGLPVSSCHWGEGRVCEEETNTLLALVLMSQKGKGRCPYKENFWCWLTSCWSWYAQPVRSWRTFVGFPQSSDRLEYPRPRILQQRLSPVLFASPGQSVVPCSCGVVPVRLRD